MCPGSGAWASYRAVLYLEVLVCCTCTLRTVLLMHCMCVVVPNCISLPAASVECKRIVSRTPRSSLILNFKCDRHIRIFQGLTVPGALYLCPRGRGLAACPELILASQLGSRLLNYRQLLDVSPHGHWRRIGLNLPQRSFFALQRSRAVENRSECI